MVISDFIFIMPEQNVATPYNGEKTVVEVYDRTQFLTVMYKYGFPLLQSIYGMWYVIYPAEPQMYTDTFFDLAFKSSKDYVVLREGWVDIVIDIIDHFLSFSTENGIYIMIRLDYPTQEVIHNKCTRNQFVELLQDGRICFDELYLVVNNDN